MTSKGEREFLTLLSRIADTLESINSKMEVKEAPKTRKKVVETKEE